MELVVTRTLERADKSAGENQSFNDHFTSYIDSGPTVMLTETKQREDQV